MKKIVAFFIGCFLITSAFAKDLKIVIPFPPGGSTDQISRELHKSLESRGINAIIEYKVGAGGLIAMNHIASSTEPTLLVNGPPVLVLPVLQKENVRYAVGENIHFQGLVGIEPTYVVTSTRNDFKSLKEIDNLTKTGFVNYGTPGIGTSSALSVDSIFSDTSKVTVVNYKGGADALQAVLKNEIHLIADSEPVVGSHISAGTLRPLAVISPSRTKSYPDVPTLRELNTQQFDSIGMYRWQGVFSNNHVSKEVLDVVRSLLKEGQLRDRFTAMGFVLPNRVEDNFMERESKKVQRILKKLQ
jgi:tripartite-type tricarboxylate transporter receptor subunit TctC